MFILPFVASMVFAQETPPPEPAITVQADGTYVCRVTVAASAEEVEALLADPVAAARLSPDVLSIQANPAGPCQTLTTTSRGMLSALKFTSKRCPTADGWHEELVASEDFSEFDGTWTVSAVDPSTTEVMYELTTKPNLPVPDAVLRQGVQRSLKTMLRNLSDRVSRLR